MQTFTQRGMQMMERGLAELIRKRLDSEPKDATPSHELAVEPDPTSEAMVEDAAAGDCTDPV